MATGDFTFSEILTGVKTLGTKIYNATGELFTPTNPATVQLSGSKIKKWLGETVPDSASYYKIYGETSAGYNQALTPCNITNLSNKVVYLKNNCDKVIAYTIRFYDTSAALAVDPTAEGLIYETVSADLAAGATILIDKTTVAALGYSFAGLAVKLGASAPTGTFDLEILGGIV